MTLPVRPLPESSVEVNGSLVTFRSLSRSEAVQVQTFKGHEDDAEVFILSRACDVSEDEAKAFRESTPAMEAGKLIDAILVFSGLATADEVAKAEAEDRELPDPQNGTSERSWSAASTVTSSS